MRESSLFDLTGKKALVVGGAYGVGRACALALAAAGADVAIAGRSEGLGPRTVNSIKEIGRAAMYVRCDVRRSEQIESMIETVAREFGRLDIAVNNAGIYRQGPDEAQSQEVWEEVISVNLTGTWLCARAEMQQMIRQVPTEGKIINIASIGASIASSNGSYDASKAGVVHLTRTLAARWGRYNINVNSISPGYLIAGMGAISRSLEERKRLRELTPLGHVQRPEDLYGSIIFLASKASDYITGQNLVVDGGHTLSTWLLPLDRSAPPRVDAAGEVVEMNRDLDAQGKSHDEDGILE